MELPRFRPPLLCEHRRYTEPDDTGRAICLDCGCIVATRITLEAMHNLRRDLEDQVQRRRLLGAG